MRSSGATGNRERSARRPTNSNRVAVSGAKKVVTRRRQRRPQRREQGECRRQQADNGETAKGVQCWLSAATGRSARLNDGEENVQQQ